MKASEKQYGWTNSYRDALWDYLMEYGQKNKKIFKDIPDSLKKEFHLPESCERFSVESSGDYSSVKIKQGRRYINLRDFDWDAGAGYSIIEFFDYAKDEYATNEEIRQRMIKKA